ncbi:MAG: hypothetical protein M0D57_06215 [Sphingobacteriales bacterium JAD_PAG50586_3]|nr:MAG: hypothetical protein M0D57_06215 [Sphingobacteriales bacterium JAD_PAG50586_3]
MAGDVALNTCHGVKGVLEFQSIKKLQLSELAGEFYVGGVAFTTTVNTCSPSSAGVPICNLTGGTTENFSGGQNTYLMRFQHPNNTLRWSSYIAGTTSTDIVIQAIGPSSQYNSPIQNKFIDITVDRAQNMYVSTIGYERF